MAEQFFIEARNANDLPVTNPQETRSEEGYLKNLTIEGILSITSTGIIRIGTALGFGDRFKFEITDEGIFMGDSIGAGLYPALLMNLGTLKFFDQATGDTSGIKLDAFNIVGGSFTSPSFVISSDGTYVNYNTAESTSKDSGALVVKGGVGIERNLHVGGTGNFTGVVTVPNATANGHALNRVTADGRYVMTGAFTEDAATTISATGSLILNVNGENYQFIVEKLP
jgi:hypothetical protein